MSLLSTLNLLDDPDILEDVDTFELRVVDETLKRLTDPTEDANLVLAAVIDGRKRLLVHDFDGDLDRLPELLDMLMADGMDIWYRDGSNEQAVDSLESLVAFLSDLEPDPFLDSLIDSLSTAF
jgi:hypothetical protein